VKERKIFPSRHTGKFATNKLGQIYISEISEKAMVFRPKPSTWKQWRKRPPPRSSKLMQLNALPDAPKPLAQ